MMRKLLRTAVLAGAAAIATAGTAIAAANHNRVMTIDLPDGSLARIEYQGDVAPKVTVEPAMRFAPVRFADPAITDRKSTSELQSLMRISYAVFCLKKKTIQPPLRVHVIVQISKTILSQTTI